MGRKNAHFYVVAANASIALYAAGFSDEPDECQQAAEDSILSGKALEKLNQLIEFGKNI